MSEYQLILVDTDCVYIYVDLINIWSLCEQRETALFSDSDRECCWSSRLESIYNSVGEFVQCVLPL